MELNLSIYQIVSKRSKFKYAHMYSILYIYPANLNMHIFYVIQSFNAPLIA